MCIRDSILHSHYVARTPPVEARSPDCRSNVENVPRRRLVMGKPATATSRIRCAILRMPPVTRQSPASSVHRPRPDHRSPYLVISRDGRKLVLGFALCCHSNATRAPIANPPNSAQLGGSLYHAPKLHPCPCSSVGVWQRTDRQTHRRA